MLKPLLAWVLVGYLWVWAQAVSPPNALGQTAPSAFHTANATTDRDTDQATAVVTFTLDFPKSQPEHCVIRMPSSGPGHYESSGRLEIDSETIDSSDFDFTISEVTRANIFALATKAGFFQGNVESHGKHLAFTGNKTLTYKDALRSGEASYDHSTNSAVQELTSIFEGLSATLESGHRLDYDHRYQKLALDEELKNMEDLHDRKLLVEVGAIQPILEQIAADQSVMNVARARAQRLLAGTRK